MPTIARGPRRVRPVPRFLDVPSRSPQRAAHEMRLLVKPHDWTRQAVEHRRQVDADSPQAEQVWRDGDATQVLAAAAEAVRRLAIAGHQVAAEAIEPPADVRLRLQLDADDDAGLVRAVAACASRAAPATWFVLGDRLALLGGRFYRRARGRQFHYNLAADLTIARDLRAALGDLLKPLPRRAR